MTRRNAFDRQFRDLHGAWPEECAEVEAEPSIELRQEMPAGPGMTMARVIQLRPRRSGIARLPLWQQFAILPGVLAFAVMLGSACVVCLLALYVIGAVIF